MYTEGIFFISSVHKNIFYNITYIELYIYLLVSLHFRKSLIFLKTSLSAGAQFNVFASSWSYKLLNKN